MNDEFNKLFDDLLNSFIENNEYTYKNKLPPSWAYALCKFGCNIFKKSDNEYIISYKLPI